jgi:hypothetical protein
MGVLFSAISFPLTRLHIARRDWKRAVIRLPNEEPNQVSATFCLTQRCVNILTRVISAFNESELRVTFEKFLDLVHLDVVLPA